MATYQYQQNVFEGATYGYVKYNITPAFGSYISAGQTVTITGQAYFKDRANKSLSVEINNPGSGGGFRYHSININIPKATVTNFSLSFQMWDVSSWTTARTLSIPISFSMWSAANMSGNGDGTMAVSGQTITYLAYHIVTSVRRVSFERYALSGSTYVKNDEGTYVLGSLALSLSEGRTVSDLTVRNVRITGDDNSTQSLTLSTAVLTYALTENGYSEAIPGLFSGITFIPGVNYTLTFTIGDAYDQLVFSLLIARAFANVHLSGESTGGVAFGKFCSSAPGNPLFECGYPIVLGANSYGPSSSMPANPREGQLFFVVD